MSWVDWVLRFYEVRKVVKVKDGLSKKIIEVKILFHPKEKTYLTPDVAESKAVYHVWDSGSIDFYDMAYIRFDTMPLLIGIGNTYELDEWLEIQSYQLMYKTISHND